MTQEPNPSYEQAEALRRNKDYQSACQQFSQLWQQQPNSLIGWRYAHCLRKLGRLADAEKIAREALDRFPDDNYTRSEMAWILYEKDLKPAKDDSHLGRVLVTAKQILDLSSDKLVLARVALMVMGVAKKKENWSLVLEWADRLRPEDLEAEPRLINGKRGMSDRETWYVNRSRALLELGRFAEARQCAQAGLSQFPDEIFLRRTAALALARSDDLTAGIAEMHALLSHPRAEWYIGADLAELQHQAGNHHDAYRLMCDAILSCKNDDKYKVRLFLTLARIALALGRLEVAAAHMALERAIRESHSWNIPEQSIQVQKEIDAAFRASGKTPPRLPDTTEELDKLCYRYWRQGRAEGLQFYRGTIKPYPEGRSFAYIERDDGGDDVYVKVRDLPRHCRQPGSRVEFALKRSVDHKKGRESQQAANIRCLRE